MTSPLRVAKVAGARARVAEILAGRCAFPDDTAREVIDALMNLGWVYPGWQIDDAIPQPATSSPAVRAQARRHLADTIRANREQRGRHTTEETK